MDYISWLASTFNKTIMARKTPKLEHAGLTHQASVNGNHIGPQHETSSVDTMTEDVTMQDDHGPNGIKSRSHSVKIELHAYN